MSLIRRAPKRTSAIVAIVAAAIIVPAVAFAWGPNRATFTMESPAPYVTFNSITNHPQVGDERNFLRIRETGASTYGDNVTLEPGKVYEVSLFYHNNAAANLNASGAGIANGVKAKVDMPGVVNAGVNAAFTSTISASNANPGTVWDEAYGKNATNGQIALRYLTGSAKFVSNGSINGQSVPDSLFTTGANLGYNSQDGVLKGCDEFSGFINFKIRVDQPNFTVKKQVSVDDGKTWVDDSVKAAPGSTVQYAISYQNTGTTQQDNVSVDDTLPAGVTYVPGTTQIANATTGGQFKATKDGITTTGVNAGSYQPKGNVFFKFSAKLPSKDALKCGTNTLVNKARVTTNAGYKEDTATVVIDKECQPEVKYACKSLGVTQIDRTNFRFNTSYTAENATFKSVTYVIKNAAGATIATETSTSTTLNYTQTTAGAYTVQATVTFTVNGVDKTATSDACKGSFKVTDEEPKKIKVCELATKKIIIIDEKDFDSSKYSKNLADCKEEVKKIKVCDLTTKQIVTIDEKDYDESKYSTDLSKCEETPVTPPELPKTGAGESIVAIVGLGALIASAAYYIASRRALNQ